MKVSSLGAERNKRYFYCVPKKVKYPLVDLFCTHSGVIWWNDADTSVNICKGGTFQELKAADTLCPAAKANRNRSDVLYLFLFPFCSSVPAGFFTAQR